MECKQYQFKSDVTFKGGKALSADSAEYAFSAAMSEGAGGDACGGSVGTYTAEINTRWDGKSKQAVETIHHHSPALGKETVVISSCPDNPWTANNNPNCKLVSVTTDNNKMYVPAIAGPYPVTAYHIGYKGRQVIANTISWAASADFILPPQTPPSIMADDGMDIDGRFYKRNLNIVASVRPPSDGSPQWYIDNLKSYDLEVAVQTTATAGTDNWAVKNIVPNVMAVTPSVILPYSKLFDDPQTNWALVNYGVHGNCRNVKVRVRIHDDVTPKPWSAWRIFMVESPVLVHGSSAVIKPQVPKDVVIKKMGGG
jgi:hypothetical protein